MVIPFEKEYREKYYKMLEQVFDSSFLSDGPMTKLFEQKFSEFTGLGSRAISSGGAGLLAIMDYIGVSGQEVIVPTNTFWATSLAVKKAGGKVVFADCNRDDLCLSYEDMVRKITPATKAVVVVHIGGHIAFEIEKIAKFCNEKGIYLVEDCAHAHGAVWNNKTAGSWGIAGSYSFYATKTMPVGEAGMVVSKNEELLAWVEKYRNYGKEIVDGKVTYPVSNGFNYRINEMTAAFGVIQVERLPVILDWKRRLAAKYDRIFENHVILPEGMISGYYKYIVFDYSLREETGKVFSHTDFGHVIDNEDAELVNSEWVAEHHHCAPIYYGWEHAGKSAEELKEYLLNQ